jgi:7-carboxy-7-deazaguanine synthase
MVPEEENDGLLDAERHQARHTIRPRAQLFPVVEKFVSVNGEGLEAGRPVALIRFAGCNCWCTYCDTRWANHPYVDVEGWSVPDLVEWVRETGVSSVMLTGGEPLLQPRPLRVEIETNGTRDLAPLASLRASAKEAGLPGELCFTLDWKTPAAGEAVSAAALVENYELLDKRDAVKFVVVTRADMDFARDRIQEHALCETTNVLMGPVWQQGDPAEIAADLVEQRLDRVRLHLQLHKCVWPEETRGV